MRILAIETSCDETAVAILEASGTLDAGAEIRVLGNALISQIDIHKEYGGVFPTIAKREHQKNLVPLLIETLTQAGMHAVIEKQHSNILQNVGMLLEREPELLKQLESIVVHIEKPDIDAIAVTVGPGLEPALWVGINFAKALSMLWDIPVIPVNHMEGHIASALLKQYASLKFKVEKIQFPLLALLISGGHTELVLMHDWMTRKIVGETRDDAVGEAFDKAARMMGLPYPGGPEISRLAAESRMNADTTQIRADDNPHTSANHPRKSALVLPRPMMNDGTCDFSFSGLKTAVLYHLKKFPEISEEKKQEVAHAFEDAVRDVLVEKTKRAIEQHASHTLVIGGGVSASTELRRAFEELMHDEYPDMKLCIPAKELTGDNAIMIGAAGYLNSLSGMPRAENSELSARGNWRIDSTLS